MKFVTEEDLTEENLAEFWQEIDELCEKADEEAKRLASSPTPEFKSIEEANKYYNATPFEEWERKMFEKYDIDPNMMENIGVDSKM